MRKIRDVLRLRFGLNLGQDQIARSCSIGQATVHRYLERAEAAGLTWPLPDDYNDRRLNELLFPARPDYPPSVPRPGLDFAEVHRQLQANRFVTLQLLWEEYREKQSGGYGYSRFCELYQRWNRNRNVTLRQAHRAGEKMFVDWAGPTVPIYDPKTGEAEPASLFVAVLGASTYTFAHAARGQHLANWIDCHIRAFEFIAGTPKLIVPDNPRTGVDRACRYEPDLNRTYHEMAEHYGTAIMPARPYKPRDKTCASYCTLSRLFGDEGRRTGAAATMPFGDSRARKRFIKTTTLQRIVGPPSYVPLIGPIADSCRCDAQSGAHFLLG
jgi:transposase